ncbi:hypothetical protein [Roseivirga pacifica]|uniref:hypothetical protein n=1 Tax=Roseivirga pacifica TaxID=1267423 RepID=UPI003BAC9C02
MSGLELMQARLAALKERQEKAKKAIPSRVIYNHFFAINYHIQATNGLYELKKLKYYNEIKVKNDALDLTVCKKLLWNAWSTEEAFNLTSKVETDDFYKFALHWHFPQAYYSAYLAMTAFHETQGIANDNHEKSIKLFGNSVKDGHYPDSISFYANGLHEVFVYHGLELPKDFDKGFNGLSKIESLEEAQTQLAMFLKTTRVENAKNKRKRGEKELAKKKDFQNGKGQLVKAFRKKHWDLLYRTIPETTLLNILYRLRLKANYKDIETFMHADFDFKSFHQCLGNIISYLNFVHEAYLHKAIGNGPYLGILMPFKGEYSIERYNKYIKPLL